MSEHRVNPELLHRTALGEILSGMHSRVSISMAFALGGKVLWPVLSGHLHYRHVCCSH